MSDSLCDVGSFQIKCSEHALEDRFAVSRRSSSLGLAVFDGHDGEACADFLARSFFPAAWEEQSSLSSLFSAAESEAARRFPRSGACAVAVVVDLARRTVRAANVGDCEAVFEEHSLSHVHRSCEEEEAERIRAAGGWVSDGRVFGVLQPSRTIGDRDLKKTKNGIPPPPLNQKQQKQLRKEGREDTRKPSGDASRIVVAEPFLSDEISIGPNGGVLVLGSDGLFDVIPVKSCVKIAKAGVAAKKTAAEVAEELVKMARERKSRDDITALVCFVPPLNQQQQKQNDEKGNSVATMEIEETVVVVKSTPKKAEKHVPVIEHPDQPAPSPKVAPPIHLVNGKKSKKGKTNKKASHDGSTSLAVFIVGSSIVMYLIISLIQ